MIIKIDTKQAILTLIIFSLVLSCKKSQETQSAGKEDLALADDASIAASKSTVQELSEDFKAYWYAGEAEITSYKLEQERYGELREGNAVLIYVTEDFLPKAQVKADNYSAANIPILKLNATKNFNTGIYPYAIMQSTFYPVANNQHAIKITSSVQEWCGQVYAQLNNRDDFDITAHSYFQTEGDQTLSIPKTWTENELWTKLRINPKQLPVGELSVIPAFEFIQLKHKPFKAYKASAKIEKDNTYTLAYPELNRTLSIRFNPKFPYTVLGWEETVIVGYGENTKTMTTKATKLESLKSAYWGKNSNADLELRKTLKLD